MQIRILEDKDSTLWNNIVDSSPQGTIFHRWEWLRIAERHTRSRLFPLIGLEGDEPVGLFPLFYLRRWLLSMVFSPPFGCAIPALGPLIINYDKFKPHKLEHIYQEFQQQVDDFINSRLHPNYISIVTSPGLLDIRPFMWSGYQVTPAYTYKIDLTLGEEGVWDGFKKKLRSDIKRVENKGLIVREGTAQEVSYLYHSLQKRYQAQNRGLLLSREYLDDLFREFGSKNLKLFTALYNDQTVGAILLITYKETTSVWLGVSKSEVAGLPTNDLIQWEAIKWAIQNGGKAFELIGAGNPRLCEFKSKYSPHLEVHFTIKKAGLIGGLAEWAYRKLYKGQ